MLAGFTDMIDGTIARKSASFAAIQEGYFIFRCSSAGGKHDGYLPKKSGSRLQKIEKVQICGIASTWSMKSIFRDF